MAKNRIAACYFPTTTLFLDDGVNFLKDLYASQGSFSAEVERIFMLPLPKLEERWITFINTFGGKATPAKN